MSLLQSSSLVRQLANRLETSNVAERISALQELQTLAKSIPHVVGELALQQVLNCLREQGDTEEYQEALDLLYRLIKTKDLVAASQNTAIFLNEISNIEILLDLLEHDDLSVGVMSSQILTEIHANNGIKLEKQIHDCPNGMNKLLLRLPDVSREEVRNQSLVLVQQLTLKNEEMKKTVVFNDGFSIIFGIIAQEGGSTDVGVVVQDCLKICKNLLTDSEPCQRFFYGMGSEWVLSLNEFFDPQLLENLPRNASLDDSGIEVSDMIWFDKPGRVACAALALDAISSSLSISNAKHQSLIGMSISSLIPTAAFWIARKGPANIVNASLSLLERVVDGNENVSEHLANVFIKITSPVKGKNIPVDYELHPLQFGWKPLSTDDRRYITLLSLLVERYIYSCNCWSSSVSDDLNIDLQYDTFTNDGLSQGCIKVLEKILSAYPTINDLTIQHVLAPPPPSDESGEMENIRPLGSLVLNILVESCNKIIDHIGINISLQVQMYKSDMEIAERAANIFALIFIYGGQLSRELSTVINTSHVVQGIPAQPLLPFLLATTGRAARAQASGHSSPTLLVALLRMLATAVSGCEKAAKLILVDPSNLFVVDLATVASENAGVPSTVQISACLFLGMCFLALPVSEEGTSGLEERLTRRSFVSMIDSKIGLTRFTDILKRPILTMSGLNNRIVGINNLGMSSDIFFTKGFRIFYETQIEFIRSGIFDFYAGENTSVTDSAHLQIIEMQKEKIFELESQIQLLQTNIPSSSESKDQLEKKIDENDKINELMKNIEEQKGQIESFIKNEANLSIENENLQSALKTTENTLNELQMKYLHQTSGSNDEVLGLKQSILQLDTERNQLKDILKNRDRKIQLLEGELTGPIPSEMSRDKKIADLEARNAELKQQLWLLEANSTSQSQLDPINWSSIFNSLKHMATKFGLQEDEYDLSTDNSSPTSDIVLKIDNTIRICTDSIVLAVGNCSDIAEAVGVYNLDGEEGSILRLKDCTEKIATRLAEREEEIEETIRKNEFLARDLDQLKMEKKSFENDLYGNKEIDSLKKIISDNKETIKNIQSENDILMAQFNDSAVRFNEEIMVLMHKEHNLVSVNDQKDEEISRLKKLLNSNSSSDSIPIPSNDLSQKDAEIIQLTSLLEAIENNSKILADSKDDEINKLKSLQETIMNMNKEKDDEIAELKQLLETKNSVDQSIELENLKSEVEVLKSQLHRDYNAYNNENISLKKALDDLKQRNEELINVAPLHIQDQEQQFLRVSAEATHLAQLLQDRDLENKQLQVLNQKKEGELAGVRLSLQALQQETESVSNELNDLHNAFRSKEADIADLKRSNESLSYSLQLETSQCEQLKNTIKKLESYNEQESKHTYDTVQLIRFMITRLSHKNVDDHKEELIEGTNLFSLVSTLKDLIEDADKTFNQKSSIVDDSSPMLTPAKEKNASIFTPSSGTERRGRGVSTFISSPAAKEMSRLHSEISHERRRLHFLQEQHSDLLGLLAQQEVELSVFKDVLEESAGSKAVTFAEEESRKVTIRKYGYYTDFRQCTVEDEIEANDDSITIR